MTITMNRAIEILTNGEPTRYAWEEADTSDAIMLGREALIAWRRLREGGAGVYNALLPGEAKAVDQRTANIGYGSSEALKKQRR